MKKIMIQFALIIALAILSSCTNEKITFESLLQEMTDREALTYFPAPAYTIKQFSSYDQRSIGPDQEGWFANRDYTHFIREETNNGRREFVLLDTDGPGAIVRYWMTFAGAGASEGTLRIYIDNKPESVVEDSVLKVLSGGLLAEEPLSTSVSPKTDYQQRGHNLYLPLPYAKHCKITYECDSVKIDDNNRKPSVYYNINYRTYKKGTQVESFSREVLDRAVSAIKSTEENLKNPEIDISQTKRFPKSKILHAGDTLIFNLDNKNKAIRKLLINLDAKDINQALRSTVLSVSFDGKQTIWCPIGDFFGTGYQIYQSNTWYSEVSQDGLMISRWVMPFREKCLVKIINYGSQKINLDAAVHISDYAWNRSSMYFGTSWHEYYHLSTNLPEEKQIDSWHFDVNYVTLEGQGLYAGDALTVFNTADAWWGEGDEKIFVDDDTFPSCIGTGTEDYYGYAWCRPETFSHPFIAQPAGKGNFHPGMTVNMRYRSLDAMPFNKKIRSDMEMWHWAKTTINFAMTSYWYAMPGFTSNINPKPEMVKRQVDLKRSDIYPPIVNEQGVIEGEMLEVVETTGGTAGVQSHDQFNWSNNGQLWWWEAEKGDQLKIRFEMAKAGKYIITGQFTRAVDYGIIQVKINGKPAGGTFNGYMPDGVKAFPFPLGTFLIKEGENIITMKIMGKDPQAKPGYMAGIDFLKFEPVK